MSLVEQPRGVGKGLRLYGGNPIPTTFGHTIEVLDSADAGGPHVWIRMAPPQGAGSPDPAVHLNLAQAIALHAVLEQFINDVPLRWSHAPRLLLDATRQAVGKST